MLENIEKTASELIQGNQQKLNGFDPAAIYRQSQLNVADNYELPPTVISVHQSGLTSVVGTSGNITTILGKPKSRKSYFSSLIAGFAISPEGSGVIQVQLPKKKQGVLVIDTEQAVYHSIKVLRRIARIAGQPEQHPENLHFLNLRSYSPDQRREVVRYAIEHNPSLGLVIIDGSRDLLYSFNDETESINLVTDFMRWSQSNELHLVNILHQNKNDLHARGHLGTELTNKSESILTVEKDGDFSVIKSNLRDRNFDDLAFGIDDDDCPYLIKDYSGKPEPKKYNDPAEQTDQFHRNLLDLIFKSVSVYDSKNKFWRALKTHAERSDIRLGDNKARAWADYYIERDFVEYSQNGNSWEVARVK